MKVGSLIRLTLLTFGEAVIGKDGAVKRQKPDITVYVGKVVYIGMELPFKSAMVVRCVGVEGTFSFYPHETGVHQLVDILEDT